MKEMRHRRIVVGIRCMGVVVRHWVWVSKVLMGLRGVLYYLIVDVFLVIYFKLALMIILNASFTIMTKVTSLQELRLFRRVAYPGKSRFTNYWRCCT